MEVLLYIDLIYRLYIRSIYQAYAFFHFDDFAAEAGNVAVCPGFHPAVLQTVLRPDDPFLPDFSLSVPACEIAFSAEFIT